MEPRSNSKNSGCGILKHLSHFGKQVIPWLSTYEPNDSGIGWARKCLHIQVWFHGCRFPLQLRTGNDRLEINIIEPYHILKTGIFH